MKNCNTIKYGKRGMIFEDLLNKTNTYYKENNICIIYKKPTPIKILKTDNNMITKATFDKKSTTDYNGVYNGYYIDFEAKTTSSDEFILSNILDHQRQHLINIKDHGGISFVLIYFQKHHKTFILTLDDITKYKKLSYDECQKYLYSITTDIYIRYIDYIKEVTND